MQISNKILTFVAICFFVSCNALAIFAFEPYESRAQVKWDGISSADEVDTVIIGNSLVEVGIVPSEMDAQLGTKSWNLGSTQQEMAETYLGLKTALQERDIQFVIVGVEPAYLQIADAVNPGKPFIRAKNRHRPFSTQLQDVIYLLSDWNLLKSKDSINWLFPYVKNHVPLRLDSVSANMSKKITGTPSILEEACRVSDINYPLGQGYIGCNKVCNFNTAEEDTYRDIFGNTKQLQEKNMAILGEICDLCKNNGADLVVIIPPLARFNVLDYGDAWFTQTAEIRELVESRNASFYDCNLIKPEYFSFEDDFYYNTQHLNVTGATQFTKTLCTILEKRESSDDTQRFFFTPDEYRLSFFEPALVKLNTTNTSRGIRLEADALINSDIDVEYEFKAKGIASKSKWFVIQDYSSQQSCQFEPEKAGEYTVRVNMRAKHSSEPYEHYREKTISVRFGETK